MPSRLILTRAERDRAQLGHDNLGPLSEAHGFLPFEPPLLAMPESHRLWDEIAKKLPSLYTHQNLREAFDDLPTLPATRDDFGDRYLLRAALMLAVFAHCYRWVNVKKPDQLPESIEKPWRDVSQRLERKGQFLSYSDIFLHNWRWIDPDDPCPMRLENLLPLIPVFGNPEERVFLMAQVEIAALCNGLIGGVVRAQEAVVVRDNTALRQELIAMTDALYHVTTESLLKIDLNPYSKTPIDPVVWAKTVARFGVPVNPGVAAPSGNAAPTFQLLDAFVGRTQYDNPLGRDMLKYREWMSRDQREFITAVEQFPLRRYVEESGDPCLQGAFHQLAASYMGDKGFLNAHRLKVYGFLETAYKVGRPSTTGGYTGSFHDEPWKKVDHDLNEARCQRYDGFAAQCPWGRVVQREKTDPEATDAVQKVVIDVTEQGLRYRAGDRCAVMPENSNELIEKSLRALKATGLERIKLNRQWQEVLRWRTHLENRQEVTLATFLRYAKLRPLQRHTLKTLYRLTRLPELERIINAYAEDQWEFWDALTLLDYHHFDARRFWRAEPWETDSICNLLPPEQVRLYSISSVPPAGTDGMHDSIRLTVGALEFSSMASDHTHEALRHGTGSNYLTGRRNYSSAARMPISVMRPSRFHLPDDERRPVVMFAGGTGIAPFIGFLEERSRRGDSGENWLFFSTRGADQFYYKRELFALAEANRLQLRVAFSRADQTVSQNGGTVELRPGKRSRIDRIMVEDQNAIDLWRLMPSEADGGKEGFFYICGQMGFAFTVLRTMKSIAQILGAKNGRQAQSSGDDAQQANKTIYRLAADRRLMQDIFTTLAPASAHGLQEHAIYPTSEIVLHNSDTVGYWITIQGQVYDMTEFVHLHPGGNQIIMSHAGTDATDAYQAVEHHLNFEINAMRDMYKIGEVKRLSLGNHWSAAILQGKLEYVSLTDLYKRWVRLTFLLIKLENAVHHDYSFMGKTVTSDDDGERFNLFKLDLFSDVHERFVREHLAVVLGAPLRELWSMSVALCQSDQPILWMAGVLEEILRSPDFERVRLAIPGMGTSDHCAVTDAVETLCLTFKELDLHLLNQLKESLRCGLMAFETHEQDTARRDGKTLLHCLESMPRLFQQYFKTASALLK